MPISNCSSPYIEDCSGKCFDPSYESKLGNNFCDDGINSDINLSFNFINI